MESKIADLLPRLREAALACRGKGTDREMVRLITKAARRLGYSATAWNEVIQALDEIDPLWRGYDPYRRD